MKYLVTILALALGANASAAYQQGDYKMDKRRGSPAEYDPGPAKDSKWVRLFGSTPNYRAIGSKVLKGGGEKFRWEFGPMWYRGRLGKNEVKAFVVGQEGAQDENVSNRAFTGSTGTKTQHFLNHIGIYSSYLFLNTFVYTINGQLEDDPNFKWLEQDEKSPIVQYRHALFDNMLEMNRDSIALFMGVGSGGKASLATWINARGGDCSTSNNMEKCDTTGMRAWFEVNRNVKIRKDILVIGVPHPGGASPANGGLNALKAIIAGFTKAAKRVAAKMEASKRGEWLEFDPEAGKEADAIARMKQDFKYGDSPVPFRDFTFGTNWRMGEQGTTSNRRGANTIQVFSDKGRYNNDGDTLKYIERRDVDSGFVKEGGKVVRLEGMSTGDVKTDDVPYESPRWTEKKPEHAAQYDNGPCGFDTRSGKPLATCELAKELQTWPDFWSGSVKPISAPSFGHGPIYRGRLSDAKVLVLADQAEHDDFFAARALTGETGQKLQTWLKVAGVGSSYAILRVLPVDTLGLETRDVIKLLDVKGNVDGETITVAGQYGKIIEKIRSYGKTQAIVAVGPVAKALAEKLNIGLVAELGPATEKDHVAAWDQAAGVIAGAIGARKQGKYDGSLTTIAREDLPSHTRWWMGSSGTRASRGDKKVGGSFVTNGDYYKVWAPNWVSKLQPKALDRETYAYLESELGGGRSVDPNLYLAWDRDRSCSSDSREYYKPTVYYMTLEEIEKYLRDLEAIGANEQEIGKLVMQEELAPGEEINVPESAN